MPRVLVGRRKGRSPPRRAAVQGKFDGNLRGGSGRGMLPWSWRFRSFPTNADELGDAGLLHRHAIKHAAHFHGLAIVSDDDELCLAAHIADEAREAPDVSFIERGVD